MGKTVEEIRDEVSASELFGWMQYFRIEPLGEERADLRMARICQVIAETNTGKRYKLEEFLFDFDSTETGTEEVHRMSAGQIASTLHALFGTGNKAKGK